MNVRPIPLLSDNYAYLLEHHGEAVIVDPSEAEPVRKALEGLRLIAIWCTHHHWDHVGGVAELATPGVEVLGSRHDHEKQRIPSLTRALDDGEHFQVWGHTVQVLAVPGHTLGAIAYHVGDELFTGDTLFLAGCGRLFEGTPAMMRASLARLRHLPGQTRIWCGHEYTHKNLNFAASIEPESSAIAQRLASLKVPSVPGTIAEEQQTNPFFRWDQPTVQHTVRGEGPEDLSGGDRVFAAVRERRNSF